MLLAFKKVKSINLNKKYRSFALGKREDTRHLTLVSNTTLSFKTQKQIVVAKKASSSNYLVTALAIRLGNLSFFNMILMYMQVMSTSFALHMCSTEMPSLYKPLLFQNVSCLFLTSSNPQVPHQKRNIKTCKNTVFTRV